MENLRLLEEIMTMRNDEQSVELNIGEKIFWFGVGALVIGLVHESK